MLHNIIHILLGIGIVGLAILSAWYLVKVAKVFEAGKQAILALSTVVESQASLLSAIVNHIESNRLSKLLEQHDIERGLKH